MNEPLFSIAGDGWKFVFGFAAAGAVLMFIGHGAPRWLGGVLLLAAVFSLYFFRDGRRAIPTTDDILSPADGRVLEVADIDGEDYGRGRVIRIFLSVFDGHVQRAPVAGTVTATRHRSGSFLNASNPRAAFENESNAIHFQTPRGPVMIRQIAGLIARRILCWVRANDSVALGDRVGLIRFGSQVDLYLPRETDVLVKKGDRVRAGETVMARWKGKS